LFNFKEKILYESIFGKLLDRIFVLIEILSNPVVFWGAKYLFQNCIILEKYRLKYRPGNKKGLKS